MVRILAILLVVGSVAKADEHPILTQAKGARLSRYHFDKNGTQVVEKKKVLSPASFVRLMGILRDPATYGGGAMCWNPHHAIELRDDKGLELETIHVCFECEKLESEKHVLGKDEGLSTKGVRALKALFRGAGLSVKPGADKSHADEGSSFMIPKF